MLSDGSGRMFTVALTGFEEQPVVLVPTTVITVEFPALRVMEDPDIALDQAYEELAPEAVSVAVVNAQTVVDDGETLTTGRLLVITPTVAVAIQLEALIPETV